MTNDLESWLKILAAVVAIIALFFTGYQISETKNALIFTTEQNLYKESREILKFMADNPALLQMMQLDDISKLEEKDRSKLAAQVAILLNFYNSVLLKQNANFVSPEFRKSLVSDFCIVAKFPQISKRLTVDKPGQPYSALADIKRRDCNV